jgi:hypothetical protein
MYSIDTHTRHAAGSKPLRRALALAALAAASVSLFGCAGPPGATPPEPVVSTMVIDKAMQQRNFEPAYANFTNTTVMTGNNGVSVEPKPDQPDYNYYVLDTTTFLANVLLMPVSAFEVPPGKDVPNRGPAFAPSYTDARPTTPN